MEEIDLSRKQRSKTAQGPELSEFQRRLAEGEDGRQNYSCFNPNTSAFDGIDWFAPRFIVLRARILSPTRAFLRISRWVWFREGVSVMGGESESYHAHEGWRHWHSRFYCHLGSGCHLKSHCHLGTRCQLKSQLLLVQNIMIFRVSFEGSLSLIDELSFGIPTVALWLDESFVEVVSLLLRYRLAYSSNCC